jgi:hypothetical protein
MAINLGITKEHRDASERVRQAILRQPKMSQEEFILQARKKLDRDTSDLEKKD